MSLKTEFRMGRTMRLVTFNQDVKGLIPHSDIDPEFLTYAVQAQTDDVLGVVEEAGHGTGVLPTASLQSLMILLPPKSEQRAIAAILGALDDKIDLNRQMNRTLEELASALFKSWFIDFDPVVAKSEGRQPFGMDATTAALFPAEFDETAEGVVPKGWQACKLLDLFQLQRGYDLPEAKRRSGIVPVMASAGQNGWHDTVGEHGPGVVTGRYGTIGQVYYVEGDYWPLNTSLFVKNAKVPMRFAWHILRNVDFSPFTDKGAVPGVNRNDLHGIDQVRPPQSVLNAFDAMAAPWWQLHGANEVESKTLAALRDLLLPQLLSGEIRIKDAEKLVAEAV